ncbi:SCAN domain-containing protein 3 [Trichonephila clavipes]|nr:SCAN domain-containing protein 3 [Trichonephila clavipes]
MDKILTTTRDLELEVNEDDIEELIMGHEDELTTEELQKILNEEHQETQRNVSPSEQEKYGKHHKRNEMFEKVSVLLNCLTISLEEFVAVEEDNVCTAPIVAGKHILELVQCSKNIIDADSEDENEMNNAALVPASSEMRNTMESY